MKYNTNLILSFLINFFPLSSRLFVSLLCLKSDIASFDKPNICTNALKNIEIKEE